MEKEELSSIKIRFLERLKEIINDKNQRVITEFDCVPEFAHPDYSNGWRFERLAERLENDGYIVRRQNTSGLYRMIYGANGVREIYFTPKGLTAVRASSRETSMANVSLAAAGA